MDDIKPHLSIYSEEGLLANNFFSSQKVSWKAGHRMRNTYSGKCPLQRAIYSFLTDPAVNSCVSSLASTALRGIIINPEVSLSNLFTASYEPSLELQTFGKDRERTIDFTQPKIVLQYLNKAILEVPPCRMHRLHIAPSEYNRDHEEGDERTMLPGLLMTIKSRSLSW